MLACCMGVACMPGEHLDITDCGIIDWVSPPYGIPVLGVLRPDDGSCCCCCCCCCPDIGYWPTPPDMGSCELFIPLMNESSPLVRLFRRSSAKKSLPPLNEKKERKVEGTELFKVKVGTLPPAVSSHFTIITFRQIAFTRFTMMCNLSNQH